MLQNILMKIREFLNPVRLSPEKLEKKTSEKYLEMYLGLQQEYS